MELIAAITHTAATALQYHDYNAAQLRKQGVLEPGSLDKADWHYWHLCSDLKTDNAGNCIIILG